MLRSLRHRWATASRRGNVAPIVALALLPLVGAVGLAVDYGVASSRQVRLQAASDAAVLSALRVIDSTDDNGMKQAAREYLEGNLTGFTYGISEFKVDRKKRRVELKTTGESLNLFGKLFKTLSIDLAAAAVATGGNSLEVVLVLDNSGSMESFGRIDALKDAASSLVEVLSEDERLQNKVSFGLVPFASSVNVGPDKRNDAWVDRAAVSPVHKENFSGAGIQNRFDLFTALGENWAGCVEARASGLDLTDTAATAADPRTLFVPMFAPDEPDKIYSQNAQTKRWEIIYEHPAPVDRSLYSNSYVKDDGGACVPGSVSDDARRQSNVCKYPGASVIARSAHEPIPRGPNYLCTTAPVLALTKQRKKVDERIGEMGPLGGTNIVEGAMWGLRVLSPQAPFTEGAAYDDAVTRKVMIVMTDGDNSWNGLGSSHNQSIYSPYGYTSRTRIGPQSSSTTTLSAQIDARMTAACNAAKAQDIVVYTVTLSPETERGKALLRACATDPTYAYVAQSSDALKPVFLEIAESIRSIRLAR